MDTRRKFWKENLLSPFNSTHDLRAHVCPPCSSSEQVSVTKTKRMGRIYNFPRRKIQEGNILERKEDTSSLHQREQQPCFSGAKDGTDTECAFRSSIHSGAPPKVSFSKAEVSSQWSEKKVPSGPQQSKTWPKGMSPKARLNLLNEELEELNLKCKEIEEQFESAEKELLSCRKGPAPKCVNFQATGMNTSKKDWELQALKNDLSEKTTDVKNLTEELQQAKEVIQKLNLENRNLKEALQKLKRQTEVGNKLLKEEMKLYYELEMEKIRLELDTIKSELRAEKALQARNSRGLELLRKHFDSMVTSSRTFHHFTDYLNKQESLFPGSH